MRNSKFKILFGGVFALLIFNFALNAQSRTNTLTRPCPGSATTSKVTIAVGGNITATPCSGGTVTINGVAISSTNSPTVLRSYLASTVTYNNTAALADTALSVTVAASGIYDIELLVHSTAVANGLNLDFAGTATTTNFIGQWEFIAASIDVATPTAWTGGRTSAPGTDSNGLAASTGGDGLLKFRGTIEVNAGGTFLLRGAQQAAVASNTTILRGSTLTLTKLN